MREGPAIEALIMQRSRADPKVDMKKEEREEEEEGEEIVMNLLILRSLACPLPNSVVLLPLQLQVV